MSIVIGVRFRPVDKNNLGSAEAREAAERRWRETLGGWPGVLSYEPGLPAQDAPVEREEVRRLAEDVPPVDLTIHWESKTHADTLFFNSELCCDLYGPVRGAPAVHIVGDPQINGTPAEIPRSGT